MFCTKCQNPVEKCECGDIDERLRKVASSKRFETDRCMRCKEHRKDCTCDEYEPIEGDS